jgi:hypothetical protein
MKFTGRPLINVSGVNDFLYSTQLEFYSGDAVTFYLQLVDLDRNQGQFGFNPAGLRYCPVTGATLSITFTNIDTSKQFSRIATQPFSQDASIWAVSILPTDPVNGTVSVRGNLTENYGTQQAPDLKTRSFYLPAAILVS